MYMECVGSELLAIAITNTDVIHSIIITIIVTINAFVPHFTSLDFFFSIFHQFDTKRMTHSIGLTIMFKHLALFAESF